MLFVVILVCHVTLPVLTTFAWVNAVFGLAFLALLGVAGWITVEREGPRKVYLGLMVLSLASSALSFALPEQFGFVIWLSYHTCFITLSAVLVVRWTVLRKQVTVDTIFAALSGYYLMGFAWALLYMVVDNLAPGSFTVDISSHFQSAFYFSFVTLTTLGYGDIAPAMPLARSLVTTEALVGQLYLVVLVARLVAMRTEPRAE